MLVQVSYDVCDDQNCWEQKIKDIARIIHEAYSM